MRTLPVQPDVVDPGLSLAIFADGCFCHGYPEHGHTPKSNLGYWVAKLERNRRHDRTNPRALRKMGFAVWRFYEHDLKEKRIANTQMVLRRGLRVRLDLKRRHKESAHGQVPAGRLRQG